MAVLEPDALSQGDLRGTWAEPLGWFFTYIVPILLVVNVPASAMVRVLDPPMVGFTLL